MSDVKAIVAQKEAAVGAVAVAAGVVVGETIQLTTARNPTILIEEDWGVSKKLIRMGSRWTNSPNANVVVTTDMVAVTPPTHSMVMDIMLVTPTVTKRCHLFSCP